MQLFNEKTIDDQKLTAYIKELIKRFTKIQESNPAYALRFGADLSNLEKQFMEFLAALNVKMLPKAKSIMEQMVTDPYKDNERNPAWSLGLFYRDLARIEDCLRGHSDNYVVFVSPDWVQLGVKPQDIRDFLCKEAVLSRQLPPGTIVACEMSKETIEVRCKQDVILIQSYPKYGTACDISGVGFTVGCSIVPVIRNGQGIMHMKVNSI